MLRIMIGSHDYFMISRKKIILIAKSGLKRIIKVSHLHLSTKIHLSIDQTLYLKYENPQAHSHNRNVHFVKCVRIWSYSGPYFPAFGLNMDQNNSEYGHFSRSDSNNRFF